MVIMGDTTENIMENITGDRAMEEMRRQQRTREALACEFVSAAQSS